MLRNYDYITPRVLGYFEKRLAQAPRDTDFALDYVKREARTPDQQQAVMRALAFKCDILWAMLDALHFAYVMPGLPPPGTFVPEDCPR
jgi:coenzyme PQQ biosynthesis protein C